MGLCKQVDGDVVMYVVAIQGEGPTPSHGSTEERAHDPLISYLNND